MDALKRGPGRRRARYSLARDLLLLLAGAISGVIILREGQRRCCGGGEEEQEARATPRQKARDVRDGTGGRIGRVVHDGPDAWGFQCSCGHAHGGYDSSSGALAALLRHRDTPDQGCPLRRA